MTKKNTILAAIGMLGVTNLLPLYAHDTDKKLDAPGYRPSTEQAAAFVKGVSSAKIAVFPTIVRTVKETVHCKTSQERIIEFCGKNRLGTGVASATEFDVSGNTGRTQWDVFQGSIKSIGKQLKDDDGDADYLLVLEFLITPTRSGGIAAGGIHCYVLNPDGENAFSFLLNSHHKLFVDAKLHTSDASAKGREQLTVASTKVALSAFKQQVAQAREDAATTNSKDSCR